MRYILKDRFIEAEQAKFACEIIIDGKPTQILVGDFIIMKKGVPTAVMSPAEFNSLYEVEPPSWTNIQDKFDEAKKRVNPRNPSDPWNLPDQSRPIISFNNAES